MFRKYWKSIPLLVLIALLIMSSCGSKEKTGKTETIVAVPVEVNKVTRGSIESKLDFLGNIIADQELKVYSTIPTRIVTMNVDVGDVVKKSQILAIVDNEKIKQAVIQAEAGLESANAQYKNIDTEWKRFNKLYKENAVSQSQFDAIDAQREAAKSAVKQLEAALAASKNQLDDSYINAPIGGIISQRILEEGDQASPGIPVFTIVKMNPVKIQIEVVENQIGLVKVGQKAHITVESYPNEQFEGVLSKINPTLNPLSRTIGAEVLVDNPQLKLRPGMFAKVEVVVNRHERTLLIPKYAVLENTKLEYLGGELTNSQVVVEKFVFIVQDSLAFRKDILTGIENGNMVEVLSGLNENEQIIIVGQHNLFDSLKVEIITNRSGL